MACTRLSTPVQPRKTAAVTRPWLMRLGALATVLLFVTPPRALGADAAAGADDFGFLTRLYNAYADELGLASAPAEPNAPPSRRPAPFPPQPENSPPYPFTEWPIGGLNPIGASLPNAVDSPLMKAIGPGPLGKTLEDLHIQIYGWVNGGGNLSTATTGYGGNAPAAYMYTPNLIQLDQAVVYIERVPDEVQQDHIDWGFSRQRHIRRELPVQRRLWPV